MGQVYLHYINIKFDTIFSFLEMLAKSKFGTPGVQSLLANYEENEYICLHPKVCISSHLLMI